MSMGYYFWAKLGLNAFYLVAFAYIWYGYRYRDWHRGDAILAGLAVAIVLLMTIVADLTLAP